MASRRKVIENLFKSGAFMGFGGLLWGSAAGNAAETELALRPPGAFENDRDFVQACIKCGQCVEVCPYDTLKLATPGDGKAVGTPYFKPREIPCYMCTDIPCTRNCPSGALDLKRLQAKGSQPSIETAKMGMAIIDPKACIAFWGIQCDVCYRACPLLDKALIIERKRNERTQKHAYLLPVVNGDHCTGCGVCEHVCVVEEAAISVLPVKIATGKAGGHYIKGWDKADEKRMELKEPATTDEEDIESGLNYLNEDNELY